MLARRESYRHTDARIVVMGARNVGKSALTVRFLTKRFIGEYDSSQDSTYNHQTTIDDEQVSLELLDTGPLVGMRSVPNCCDQANRIVESRSIWGDIFLLVYSITNKKSFDEIRTLHQAICTIKPRPVFMILGNKSDLEHDRRVKKSEGDWLAAELKCSVTECSAAESYQNVAECFHELYREWARRKRERRTSLSPKPLRHALGKVFRRNSTKGLLLAPPV